MSSQVLDSSVSNVLKSRELQGNCPSGGSWYACTTGPGFVGCCQDDPCDSGCDNVTIADLGSLQYGTFPDQDCDPGFAFYTCENNPELNLDSFFGCCGNDPCADGNCSSLGSAYLAAGDNPFIPSSTSTTDTTSSDTSTRQPSTTSTVMSSSPPIATSNPTQSSGPITLPVDSVANSRPNVGMVAGGVVGGVAAVAIIATLLLLRCRQKMLHSRKHQSTVVDGWLTKSPVDPLAEAGIIETKGMDLGSEHELPKGKLKASIL